MPNDLTRGNLTDEELLTVARRINREVGAKSDGCHHVQTSKVVLFPQQWNNVEKFYSANNDKITPTGISESLLSN